MIKTYIKIAWRNIKGNPLFSSINVLGLTLSLAISTLLFMFINHENSFNTMFSQKNQIYRVLMETSESHSNEIYATVPAMVAPTSMVEIPEVLDAVRFLKHGFGEPAYISTGDSEFIESSLYYADSSLFKIFDFKLIQGFENEALVKPNTAIISKNTALLYFGTDQVIGKLFKIDDRLNIEITGVFQDLPSNTTLDGNVYVSFATSFFSKRPTWSNASLETYILTAKGATQKSLKSKFKIMLDKHIEKESQWYALNTQQLERVHLYSSHIQNAYSSRKGSIDQVKSLSWLALLILVIACINYMNLTTARSQIRSREIGVSKTLGASISNLMMRFYAETGLITAISMLLGIGLALLCLPLFNQIAGKEIPDSMLWSVMFLLSLVTIWVITTLLAGSYPAIYMSHLSAKNILKGGKIGSFWATNVRKGLVVIQFGASTVLIIGVVVIYNQLKFIQEKDLGFDTEQVMAISINGINDVNNVKVLEQELGELSMITNVGAAQGFPGKTVSGRMVQNPLEDDGGISVQTNRVDAEALNVMGLRFIAGKNIPVIKSEGDSLVDVVVNKKIADYLGYTPEEAIGKNIQMLPSQNAFIVGVVDDFNYASLREPIGAYAFHNFPSEYKEYLLVKMKVADLQKSISSIEKKFKKVAPNIPFDYSFLDQNIEQLYLEEKQTASIGMVFSLLAIFVACLGLFGLAAFTAEQRGKEIGIRKVLGASVTSIVKLLSADFIKLVAIALLISFPLAYYVMNNWLQDFTYRINMSWQPFVFTGLCAIGIAMITVSFQAVKAAVANPVDSLKTE
ncbi:ABC transporter permease [Psychroserpens ponticola]|uniref:ABC transporter permease n=1 Tax=Psychroserpens ponticola TaxID=2932268 RepID=A0ABY7RZ44_9FLAO|nr:ABC transporter permease [Psychroserpens ponticola]WCO02313.1 ABC transporter permease [Psychroserpens ponticola]